MATLRGWAIPTSFWSRVDHTYVTCDGGYAWPCWGRSSGGRNICTGRGSSAQANCISWPRSTAGIVYGVTGVCHQTANRILWPARALVSGARGYWASCLLYGAYGDAATWLAKLAACGLTTGEIPQCGAKALPRGAMSEGHTRKALAYFKKVQSLYAKSADAGPQPKALKLDIASVETKELAMAFSYRLGKSYPAARLNSVLAKRARFRKSIASLADDLHSRKLKGAEFAKKANKLIAATLFECAGVMGAKDYAALTELDPREPVALVDPEIAAKEYK